LQAKSLTRITRDTYADYYLAISPDGLQLAYISDWFDSPDTGKRYKLQVLDTKSNTVRSVAESASQLGIPSWSPDSKTIAFGELSNDNNYLCIVDFSSRKLTKYTIDFIDLTWSPNGIQLGVSTRGEQFSGIYILDAMTGNIEKELRTTDVPFRIAWSPIDNKLLFQSRIYLGNDRYDKKTSLDLLDIETGSITTLQEGGVDGSTDEYHLLWSKDGKYIAYFIEPRQVVIWSVEANRVVESFPLSGYGTPADAVWIFPRILFQVDGKYVITTEGDNLNLRDGPELSAQTLKRLRAGDSVTIVDGPQYSDGYTWWKFKSEDNVIGWAVENSEWYEPVK
jgi:Tol biopolymer transport system component